MADPESTGSNIYQVSLSVAHGVLTLSGTGGLTFLIGNGTQNSTMTFQGTIPNINAALNGMIYRGNLNFNGTDALVLTTNDLGNSCAGGPLQTTSSVAIIVNPVNDAPTVTVNAPSGGNQALEGQSFTYSGASTIVVADVDAGDTAVISGNTTAGKLHVVLTVPAGTGTLTLVSHNNLTEVGTQAPLDTGTGSTAAWTSKTRMEFVGTVADINTALATLRLDTVADFSGNATITIAVDDQGNTGSGGTLSAPTTTDTVFYTDVNDAPKITLAQSGFAFLQMHRPSRSARPAPISSPASQ